MHCVAVKAGAVNSTRDHREGFLNSCGPAGTGTGLLGAYYSDQFKTLIDPPTLVRTDATINVDWSTVSPDPSITQTHFTVRWTGSVQPQFSEPYTFYAETDDGARLWVNGQLLVDDWVDQSPVPWNGTLNLVAQQRYNIEMDYYRGHRRRLGIPLLGKPFHPQDHHSAKPALSVHQSLAAILYRFGFLSRQQHFPSRSVRHPQFHLHPPRAAHQPGKLDLPQHQRGPHRCVLNSPIRRREIIPAAFTG